MTQEEREPIERAIGRLEGKVESLIRQWRDQDQAAAVGRIALHDKVEGLRNDVTSLTGKVNEMNRDIIEIKPVVQESRDRHQQAAGAKWAIAFVWSAIVTAIGAVSVIAVEVIKHFWTKP